MPPAKKTAHKTTKKAVGGSAAKKTSRTATKRSPQRTLSASHKRALHAGRTNAAVVDRYLAAINTPKRRGRKVTKATLEQRLLAAQAQVRTATGVQKVLAAQNVRDLQAKIAEASVNGDADIKSLEAAFVKVAKQFGEQRGISYAAWRAGGVSAVVLKRAGVARTRG